MRVLLLSHNYVHKAPRVKLDALARFDDLELTLAVPHHWVFRSHGYIDSGDSYVGKYAFKVLHTWRTNTESKYLFRGLSKLIGDVRPDIIHSENGPGSWSYFQANILKRLYCPRAKSIVFTWWNLPYKIRRPWLLAIERFNFANTDLLITGNEDAKLVHRERGYRGPVEVLSLWGERSDIHKQFTRDVRKEHGLSDFTIGFVGRVSEQKGIITLLDACAGLNGMFNLLLVGRGDLSDQLEPLAKERGIAQNIHVVNAVPHAQLPNYYAAIDAFVLPSLTMPNWKEQFGHVLIEAMSAKVPIIGSNSGEIPNIIGDAGLIFKEGDSEDLRRCILALMHDKRIRTDLVEKGYQRLLDNYTHERIAERYVKIYRSLVK